MAQTQLRGLIGNAGALAEYIPAGGGADIIKKAIDIITIIGNAASISAVIDESLIYVSVASFEEHINESSSHFIQDATTGTRYQWGINNGQVYIEEVG